MKTENGKEFKNDLFKKIVDKLGRKHNFLSPYHPQSNGVLEKFHWFLKHVLKTHSWYTWLVRYSATFPLVSGSFWVSTLKKALSSFFLAEILSPKIRYIGDPRGLLNLEAVRYALARNNICLNRQRSNKDHTSTRSPDKFKVSDLFYIKNHASSTWEPKWESVFHLIKLLIPCSAILESNLNGKTRIVNIRDMQLADPMTAIETKDIPPNR